MTYCTSDFKTNVCIIPSLQDKNASELQNLAWNDGNVLLWLRTAFDTFCHPDDWKNPFEAIAPQDVNGRDISQSLIAGICWYHGVMPTVSTVAGKICITSPGYSA